MEMDIRQLLTDKTTQVVRGSPGNLVMADIARVPEAADMQIYDTPILGFGSAEDALFDDFKRAGVIGPHHLSPTEWMPSAQSLISFFLPFTEQVRKANRRDYTWPAWEWMHARIEGQAFIVELTTFLVEAIKDMGHQAMAPLLDSRFHQGSAPGTEENDRFNSNWSERHCAYVCGLGTFGLSRGLITEKGIAGRFGSVITTLPLQASPRPYTDVYEYCTRCGACIPHCPPDAISLENGKDQLKCGAFVRSTIEAHRPYYGCGKCQVAVPCETRIPPARKPQ